MIEFRLDPGSGVTTYLQLVHQVKQALRLDLLRPDDQLPTARQVVNKLAINPNTVHKAYRELEREGLVVTRQGQGTFVVRTLANRSVATHPRLRRKLDNWLHEARAAGLDHEDVAALFAVAARDCFAAGVA